MNNLEFKNKLEKFLESTHPVEQEIFNRFFQQGDLALEEKRFICRCILDACKVPSFYKEIKLLELTKWLKQFAEKDEEILQRLLTYLVNHSDSADHLTQACSVLKLLTSLKGQSEELWFEWGHTLLTLSQIKQDARYLHQAQKKFVKALHFSSASTYKINWSWAKCLHLQGHYSGEAVDIKHAIEKYQEASTSELVSAEFFNDYGNALSEFAFLINKNEYLLEAIDCYEKSIHFKPDFFAPWLNLGCLFERFYSQFFDQKFFVQANHCFEKAAAIHDHQILLWTHWAHLYLVAGKANRDLTKIEISLDKFARAHDRDPQNAFILSRWGEAEMILGGNKDQLDLLKSAEQKILKSIKLKSDEPDLWALLGSCLNEIGRYFSEEKYYLQAIEKFQQGLALDTCRPLLWYGLALAHFALGDLLSDKNLIEKSIRYCSRVLEFGGSRMIQFWNDWGVAYMKLAEMTHSDHYIENAVEKFEFAFSLLEDGALDPELLYNYGCALDFLGDFKDDTNFYEKAIDVLTKALEIDPEYQNARYNLALAYSHYGESASDIDALQKASDQFHYLLSHDPEDEMSWNDWGLTLISHAQLVHDNVLPSQGKQLYDQAESKLLHAAALGCESSYYNLACLYTLTDNFTLAMHYLERAQQAGSLPGIDDMLHDEWLEKLRSTNAFKQFLSNLAFRDR